MDSSVSGELSSDVNESILWRVGILEVDNGSEVDSSASRELSSDVNEAILWRVGVLKADRGSGLAKIDQ